MFTNIFILAVALYLVIKGSTMATRYAGRLAESFNLSRYTVGFIIIAIISILPETFISITSAVSGVPEFGLGTLFGSNIADLTLIFAIIIWYSGRSLKVESKILKNQEVYPFLLLLPVLFGLNGHLSRVEGIALIIVGASFYYMALRDGNEEGVSIPEDGGKRKNFLLLLFSMAVLLVGSHFTVTAATSVANNLHINPILIGMLVVGVGTTMPEFFFALKSAVKKDDSLAIGDILGTVLADATVVVGILAVIKPFYFPIRIVYITGAFMVVASYVLFKFMRSGRTISRREASLLLIFWLVFAVVEFLSSYGL